MSINWPKPHHNSAAEFSVSGWPYVTSSSTVANQAFVVNFPFVTQWVQVKNLDSGMGQDIRFGFTENGVNNGNYYRLSGGTTIAATSLIMNIKCTQLWFRGVDITKAIPFNVIAGLTNVPAGDFPVISGSNGFGGVG